jgi:hypothetical protein
VVEVSAMAAINGNSPPAQDGDFRINDACFIESLDLLKKLRSFLIHHGVSVVPEKGPSYLSFGELNDLQYDREGRAPTEKEWEDVEAYTQQLYPRLTEKLGRLFNLENIPGWVSILPVPLALIALLSLILALALPQNFTLEMTCYLFWLISLGAIGSVAFIGMNALSVQQDITFDVSNRKLMTLRISLGALFGMVLTLPFGFIGFDTFIHNPGHPLVVSDPKISLLLLLPFVLGFSTSVVIVFLNRLVDSVQAFFGRLTAPAGSDSASPASPSAKNGSGGLLHPLAVASKIRHGNR